MIELSKKWAPRLVSQPETGMGYQICRVTLVDGRVFDAVTVVGGTITSVEGQDDIPFGETEIRDITVAKRR